MMSAIQRFGIKDHIMSTGGEFMFENQFSTMYFKVMMNVQNILELNLVPNTLKKILLGILLLFSH